MQVCLVNHLTNHPTKQQINSLSSSPGLLSCIVAFLNEFCQKNKMTYSFEKYNESGMSHCKQVRFVFIGFVLLLLSSINFINLMISSLALP